MSRNRIEQHPDEYREDLNPDYEAGENRGLPHYRTVPASEIKDLTQRYTDLRDDQLRSIPIVMEGERLEQGAAYYDLRYPERGIFKARGDMVAGPENWYVPKSELDYELWNLITGEAQPERLGGLTRQTS